MKARWVMVFWIGVAGCVPLFAAMFKVWVNQDRIGVGYLLTEEATKRRRLRHLRQQLKIERAAAWSPEQLQHLAHRLSLEPVTAERVLTWARGLMMTGDPTRFRRRVSVLWVSMMIGLLGVGLRAAQLQVGQYKTLSRLASSEYLNSIRIAPRRGNIYDREGRPLAISVDVPSIFANPMAIDDPRDAARRLAAVLGMDRKTIYDRLSSERLFVWLQRQVSPSVAKRIENLNIEGVGVNPEPRRFYPNKEIGAHLIGLAGVDGKGLEGVERALDDYVVGEPQVVRTLRDARGNPVLTADADPQHHASGANVYLSVDLQIQHAAEIALAGSVAKWSAKSGTAVVLDVPSGEVLAVAVAPEFNLNQASNVPAGRRRNRALTDMYEPGSTLKPLVMASALDAGVIGAQDQIFCEEGAFAIGTHRVKDGEPHGWMTLDQIIQKSSNVGAAKVGMKLGKERLADYLRKLGFGRRSGVLFPGETAGRVRAPKSWSDVGLATISFGHGMATSTLQLAAAYRTLAAGGIYRQPRLVRRIERRDGEMIPLPSRAPDRRVLSAASVASVGPMLEAAVGPEGTGFRAAVSGYRVAGKTGTAQKVDLVAGGYSRDRFVAVFGGFVPADKPRAVIVVAIDEPQPRHTGGTVAAPVFSRIAEATMRHLGVVPSGSVVQAALLRAKAVPVEAEEVNSRGETTPVSRLYEPETGGEITPSFLGLTAKQAIQKFGASNLGTELEVVGSGVVVRQHPDPDHKIDRGRPLHLSLAWAN